ncbi:hypothetical protein OQA88_7944 [Cercophora sp. LCS_1]
MANILLLLITALAATLASAADFQYRFYSNTNCNHNEPAISTWPRINLDPFKGSVSNCYDAPTGTDWQRLEIDQNFSGTDYSVITFCHVDCKGAGSPLQKGTHCFVPSPGCAIGSL